MGGARTSAARSVILVVDGDRRVRSALWHLLRASDPNWTVTAVADSAGAQAQVRSVTPDVVLVDVALRDPAGGLDLIANLCRQELVVVAISAVDGHRLAALAHGASTFLPKGASPDTVVTLVRQVLTDGAPDPRLTPRPHAPRSASAPSHMHVPSQATAPGGP